MVAAHDTGERQGSAYVSERKTEPLVHVRWCLVSNGKVVTGPWAGLVRCVGIATWEHTLQAWCGRVDAHISVKLTFSYYLPLLILTFSLANHLTFTHLVLAHCLAYCPHLSHISWHTYAHRNHFILTHANLVRHPHSPTLKCKHSNISTRILFLKHTCLFLRYNCGHISSKIYFLQ